MDPYQPPAPGVSGFEKICIKKEPIDTNTKFPNEHLLIKKEEGITNHPIASGTGSKSSNCEIYLVKQNYNKITKASECPMPVPIIEQIKTDANKPQNNGTNVCKKRRRRRRKNLRQTEQNRQFALKTYKNLHFAIGNMQVKIRQFTGYINMGNYGQPQNRMPQSHQASMNFFNQSNATGYGQPNPHNTVLIDPPNTKVIAKTKCKADPETSKLSCFNSLANINPSSAMCPFNLPSISGVGQCNIINAQNMSQVKYEPATASTVTNVAKTLQLKVFNLPKIWTFENIQNFLDMADIESPKCITIIRNEMDMTATLDFASMEQLMQVKYKLHDLEIAGKILKTEGGTDIPNLTAVFQSGDKTLWRPDLDINQRDPKGLYGLRRTFLYSLQIKPPLEQWVNVTNFKCDKAKLCELLQAAGRVVMCDVIMEDGNHLAQVMYSHPLEAVQAIATLHNKPDIGLHIVMGSAPDRFIAPFMKNELKHIRPAYNILEELGKHLKGESTPFCRSMFYEPQVLVPQLYSGV